jgi:hypothetical protein
LSRGVFRASNSSISCSFSFPSCLECTVGHISFRRINTGLIHFTTLLGISQQVQDFIARHDLQKANESRL